MSKAVSAIVGFALCTSTALAGNSHYPHERAPLQQTPFTALPLGSVRAHGWLLHQLEMQRDGLTGRAETSLVEIASSSAWLGGTGENWEKGPYYVKGLVPLAYTLDDAELKQRAQKWIDWTLNSQRADGFYGPANNDDWWPRMVPNYFLRDYYEATNDPRVLPFLTKYYSYMSATLPTRPLRDWGKARVGDDMDTALWLYRRTGDAFLLDVVDLMRKQAYDWPTILRENAFLNFGLDFHPKHNVNVPQAAKMPAVSWLRTGDARERTSIAEGDANLMRENGTSLGLQSGTEFLAGRSSGQGVEFCSIVEQMLSDETIVRIFGEGRYADRLERLAFNALPAAWNRDLTALQYYTVTNQVIAKRGRQGFGQDYDNAVLPGPRSGYPCCCFNVHHGWPKFVQSSWAATADNGLAAIVYAPTTVRAKVADGVEAMIVETTDYPFGDTVKFTVTVPRPTAFPLVVRVPGWCESGATFSVNGEAITVAAKPGEFAKVDRTWQAGDVLSVVLPMSVRATTGVNRSVSLHRGPLTYALRVGEEWKSVGEPAPGFPEYEIANATPWNYALAIDPRDPAKDIELLVDAGKALPANPFDKDHTPVKLKAKARLLPAWKLGWNGVMAADPPTSPVKSAEPIVDVTLMPAGAQNLRVTDLPWLGVPSMVAAKAQTFTFDDSKTDGWVWHGGGWFARDGALRSVPNGGSPGFRALIENVSYDDVMVEADVTVPEAGDAGVVARITRPSIGADTYQGYYAGVSAQGRVTLGRADGTSWQPLAEADMSSKPGAVVRIKLTAKGSTIQVRIGDAATPLLSANDATWSTGQVGVRTYCPDSDKSFGVFDNVRVEPIGAKSNQR